MCPGRIYAWRFAKTTARDPLYYLLHDARTVLSAPPLGDGDDTMSVLVLWLSKVLWGWQGVLLGLGLIAGLGLLVAGIVRVSCRRAGLRH